MGGQQSSSESTSLPIIPWQLRKLINQSSKGWLEGLQAAEGAGGLASLLKPNPEQIAQLTPDQMTNIGQLQGIAQNGSPQENQAQSLIDQLTGGAIGSSPATSAAMRAYQQNVMPTIQSGLAASGGGRGGEMAAALQQGTTSAYVPLVQQEIANREAGIGQEAALGQQRSGDISTAMGASDQIRQIQQAQYQSQFDDLMRRQGLIQNFIQGPTAQLAPNLFGQKSTTSGGGGGKF